MADTSPSTTIPGGRYISADGYWQNAEGQYIDKDGNVVKEPIKATEKPAEKPKAP